MSWKDIIKAPYDMQEYDAEFDSKTEGFLDEILSGRFDDEARKAQISTTDPIYYASITDEEYKSCLRTTRNDHEELEKKLKEMYNVQEVEIFRRDSGEDRWVRFTR